MFFSKSNVRSPCHIGFNLCLRRPALAARRAARRRSPPAYAPPGLLRPPCCARDSRGRPLARRPPLPGVSPLQSRQVDGSCSFKVACRVAFLRTRMRRDNVNVLSMIRQRGA